MSKAVRFAAGVKAGDYAEAVATNLLQENQKRQMRNDKSANKKGKKRRGRKQPTGGHNRSRFAGINKGLLAEFVIFVLLQGFDLISNIWVLNESVAVLSNVAYYQNHPNVSLLNNTVPTFCAGLRWSKDKLTHEVEHFSTILYLYCAFLAITAFIFTSHLLAWLYTLKLSLGSRGDFNENTREKLVKMKVLFLIAASILEDIPLSALSAELFSLQQGQEGLACWYCKVSGLCGDSKLLDSELNRSFVAIWLNFVAIGVTSLWKGISSFYRWSRVEYCEAFYIRACTSVFTGSIYSIVILSPAMTVLKYRYFVRPGVIGGLAEDIIDRIYIIGAIVWIMVFAIVGCCPLLNLIRVTDE